MPEVSVIIPLYNKGPYIARAINSVLNQTFKDIELVIVDDGSTDNGANIVMGYKDPRIRLIQQENRGASRARNRGAEETTTDFIAFLDADDEWMPSHLDVILKLKERYPEAGMYTTACKVCLPNGDIRLPEYRCIPIQPWEGLLPNYFISIALGEFPTNSSVTCVPKKIFFESGGFPEGYNFGEELDLFGKIALKYPVAFSWEAGAIYHWDVVNCNYHHNRQLDYVEPFIKSAMDALKRGEVAPEFIEPLNEFISAKEIPRAMRNVLAGNGKNAQIILKNCKTKWQYRKKTFWLILSILPYPLLLFLQRQKRLLHNLSVIRHRGMKNG
jgi:glycosyltransferase involved in cell wall biosynthesis